jgi:hypothetical protein
LEIRGEKGELALRALHLPPQREDFCSERKILVEYGIVGDLMLEFGNDIIVNSRSFMPKMNSPFTDEDDSSLVDE